MKTDNLKKDVEIDISKNDDLNIPQNSPQSNDIGNKKDSKSKKNPLKRDLNLFDVYKNSSGSGDNGKSTKLLVTIIMCFVIVAALIFGGINLAEFSVNKKTKEINAELKSNEIISGNSEYAKEKNRNALLNQYSLALNTAKGKFNKCNKIDSSFLNKINESVPSGTTVKSLTDDNKTVTITCTSTDFMAPAVFTQALNKRNIMSNITYGSVTKDDQKSIYSFTLTCTIKEGNNQ